MILSSVWYLQSGGRRWRNWNPLHSFRLIIIELLQTITTKSNQHHYVCFWTIVLTMIIPRHHYVIDGLNIQYFTWSSKGILFYFVGQKNSVCIETSLSTVYTHSLTCVCRQVVHWPFVVVYFFSLRLSEIDRKKNWHTLIQKKLNYSYFYVKDCSQKSSTSAVVLHWETSDYHLRSGCQIFTWFTYDTLVKQRKKSKTRARTNASSIQRYVDVSVAK